MVSLSIHIKNLWEDQVIMTLTENLGKDIKGRAWIVEIDEQIPLPGRETVTFYVYPTRTPPKKREYPSARAELIIETANKVKLAWIDVIPKERRSKLGSLLLIFVEQWLRQKKLFQIYGEISNSPDLYVDFGSIEDYITVLSKFYIQHKWTWQLMPLEELKTGRDEHVIGIVSKNLKD